MSHYGRKKKVSISREAKLLPILPAFLWLTLFSFTPSLLILILSFCQRSEQGLIDWTFTFDNYLGFQRIYIQTAAKRSFIMAFAVASTLVILAYPLASFLGGLKKHRQTALILMLIPFWANTLLRLYAISMLIRDTGFINEIITSIPVVSEPIQMLGSRIAVFIGYIYIYIPYMALPIYAASANYDSRLDTIANDLGASSWSKLVHLRIPLIRKGIYNGFAIVFLLILGDFLIPQILGQNRDLYLSNIIYNQFAGESRNWPLGSTLAIITLILGIFSIRAATWIVETIFFRSYGHVEST